MVADEVREPLRGVDGAVAVVLGRAPLQLAGVQLVQLPLDPEGARLTPGVLRLQADDFTPAHARIRLVDVRHELVVAAGQQGRAFGDQQGAEHGGDLLLGAPMLTPPMPAPSPAAALCHIPVGVAGVHRVEEDAVQELAVPLHAVVCELPQLLFFPRGHHACGDVTDRHVAERGQQVCQRPGVVLLR
ncbi:hypothetical protein [Actinacidiphila acididurans]|uniref:hypothetical protein n=1 Tax=Actinacidiphila acididurans TaxID=2784346 RepID=UPI001F17D446|nr:hypothetical protein [Actinacidiphila acididurans]